MKIAVVGSTGGSGREIVKQALAAGHDVTAFARSPEKLGDIHNDRLTISKGDVHNYNDVEVAILGQDAVLCALGNPTLKPDKTTSEGTRNIVRAMTEHGVRRFICETSLGVGDSREQAGFFFSKIIIPTLLKNAIADKEIQEQIIRESGLDWTIIRPGGLTDGERTGNYRAGLDRDISGRISRADVADFMLRQLESDEFIGKTPAICY